MEVVTKWENGRVLIENGSTQLIHVFVRLHLQRFIIFKFKKERKVKSATDHIFT
jgi:hypothetical protein